MGAGLNGIIFHDNVAGLVAGWLAVCHTLVLYQNS